MINLCKSAVSGVLAIIMFVMLLNAIQARAVPWAVALGALCLLQCYLAASRLLMFLLPED